MSDDLNAIIDANMSVFKRPGVLSVRPGFKVINDWITPTPAIVVTVRDKLAHPPDGEALPTELEGVALDVRQATPRKRRELEDPEALARQLRLSPDLGSVPHFADERTPSGERPAQLASAHAELARRVTKPQLDYTGPADATLDPIQAPATITLSASPDTGWPTLRSFLQATEESLVVGLYDFTSKHVLDAVTADLAGKQLTLVLDHPPKNPTAEQTDADTVADLRDALADDFTQAWALTRTDADAAAWIYPTAYHIKVAVRDHAVVWLSSGNWNNSNQPDIDPNTADGASEARHRDRDWHVVIEQPQIAQVFEAYLLNDEAVAREHNNPPEAPGDPLLPPKLGSTTTPPFQTFFDTGSATGTINLAPLLTPDPGVYVGAVKALIESAQTSLYMQFQYIELPREGVTDAQGFVDLVQAVIDRQQAGVDVRIIMSEFETAGYLEQLQGMGLDVSTHARLQNNVHNKGIVVDGQAVLVSSQNWSTDGTLHNRDAGVIINDPGAAAYFQQIFLHDWEHLARQQSRPD